MTVFLSIFLFSLFMHARLIEKRYRDIAAEKCKSNFFLNSLCVHLKQNQFFIQLKVNQSPFKNLNWFSFFFFALILHNLPCFISLGSTYYVWVSKCSARLFFQILANVYHCTLVFFSSSFVLVRPVRCQVEYIILMIDIIQVFKWLHNKVIIFNKLLTNIILTNVVTRDTRVVIWETLILLFFFKYTN